LHRFFVSDPEMQLRELREYAQHRGWTITETYSDTSSGSRESRTALDQLMADAQRRRFESERVEQIGIPCARSPSCHLVP
jgi:DNA invertase Pin-like site-specific DNA recombinase